MQNNKTLGKKGMSISIVILVALTLIITVLTIEIFVISDNGKTNTLNVPNELDGVYSDANYFNFYFDNVLQKTASETKPGDNSQMFLQKLNDELIKTKFYPTSNSNVEYGPISESSITIAPDKVTINLDVEIIKNDSIKSGGLGIKYNYVKTFEKKF